MIMHIVYKDGNTETIVGVKEFHYSEGTLILVESDGTSEIELGDMESFEIVRK